MITAILGFIACLRKLWRRINKVVGRLGESSKITTTLFLRLYEKMLMRIFFLVGEEYEYLLR